MGRIISIGTAVPQFSSNQVDILDFMHAAYRDATASRKLNALFHFSGIERRHSVLPDFSGAPAVPQIFAGEDPPDIEKRMEVFREKAVNLAMDAISNALSKHDTGNGSPGITHLITVSCTGLHAPGIDNGIMERMALPDDIFHTSLNYLGCNAAFPALKIADLISRTENDARILVVCVELCTIHFQPANNSDNLLSNTIFSDGAAAVLMVSNELARKKGTKGLDIDGFYSTLLGKGKELMGWNVTPLNFGMILSTKIPGFIGERLEGIITKTKKAAKMKPGEKFSWAVHPGGRRILDKVKESLSLTDADLGNSYAVLREYGNMSSPTVLFVLARIMSEETKSPGKVLALGFGPGISVDAAMLSHAE